MTNYVTETRAEVIRSGRLRRGIRLSSPITATIEYDGCGLGYESVLVNGQVAARQGSRTWFAPRFEFSVPSPRGPLPASLNVRVGVWLRITALEIVVAGEVVYAEGDLCKHLPIPSGGSHASADALPRPGSPEQYQTPEI